MPSELFKVGVGLEQTKACRFQHQHQWHGAPDPEQYHLAVQVIANLDFFLVFKGGLIDFVVPARLEKQMPNLT